VNSWECFNSERSVTIDIAASVTLTFANDIDLLAPGSITDFTNLTSRLKKGSDALWDEYQPRKEHNSAVYEYSHTTTIHLLGGAKLELPRSIW